MEAELYKAKSISASLNNNAFQLRIRTQFAGNKNVNFDKPGRIVGRFVEVKKVERVRTGVSRELDAEYKRLGIADKFRNELESGMDDFSNDIRNKILSGAITKKKAMDEMILKGYSNNNFIGYAVCHYARAVNERRKVLKNEGKL